MLGVTVMVVVGSGLLLILLTWLFLPSLSAALLVPPGVLVAAAIAAPAIAVRTAFVGTLRARNLVRACIAFQVGEATLAVAVVIGLVAANALTHLTMVAALLGTTLIMATVAVRSWAKDPGMKVEAGVTRAVLTFSIPLVLQGVIAYLIASFGQVLALPLLGPSGAGIYAYAYRFGMAMLLVSTAFSAAWTPAFLREAAALSMARSIKARVTRYWTLMLLIAATLMLALPPAAVVLGTPEYDSAASLIPTIIYAYVWHVAYNLVVVFHLESNQTVALAAGSTAAFGLSVAVSIPLTLSLGVTGLAMSAPLAYAILFGIQTLLTSESRRRSLLGDLPLRLVVSSACILGILPALLWALGYPNA
jgi:O-antigen/teichoic acid export membrane protein